jgi:hypothetical protein
MDGKTCEEASDGRELGWFPQLLLSAGDWSSNSFSAEEALRRILQGDSVSPESENEYFAEAPVDAPVFRPHDVRILIRTDEGPYHSLTKIVPYADGGFAVLVPYHKARTGWLAKMPADYNKTSFRVTFNECLNYSAEDRVKLSYHADGFVQFSSETAGKIISGRDPVTGEPKGLGLMTSPISNPIRTGPTFSIAAWPLSDFVTVSEKRATDLLFESPDLYYSSCTPEIANGVLLEAFVFDKAYWSGIRRDANGEYRLSMFHPGAPGPGSIREWKIVRLANYQVIGLSVSLVRVTSPHPSGFSLHGPGVRRRDGTGEVLMAAYPDPTSSSQSKTPLDR